MTHDPSAQTAVTAWLDHAYRTDPEVRRDFDNLSAVGTPHGLADAMRDYAEGHASPFKHDAVAQMDFAAIAADRWPQDRSAVHQLSFTERLERQRVGARGRA